MTAVELLERDQDVAIAGDASPEILSQEVEQFLEEARRNQPAARPGTGYMEYRVPFPGVRYYSFQA